MSNREILFRGKQKDTGEFVEGFYFCMVHNDNSHVHHFIMPLGIDLTLGTPIEKIQVEVDPETVCQYTGLTDKNGRKIFEGDIVKRQLFEEYIIGEVAWLDIGFCGFYLKCGNKFYPTGKDEYTGISGHDEVIGNIFDNPELMEVDK